MRCEGYFYESGSVTNCRCLGLFWPQARGSILHIPIYTWLQLQVYKEFLEHSTSGIPP